MSNIEQVGFEEGIPNDQARETRMAFEFALRVSNMRTFDGEGTEVSKPRRLGIRVMRFNDGSIVPELQTVGAAAADEYWKETEYQDLGELGQQVAVTMEVGNNGYIDGQAAGFDAPFLANNPNGDSQWDAGYQKTASEMYPYQDAIQTMRPPTQEGYSPFAPVYSMGYMHYHYRKNWGTLEPVAPFNILDLSWEMGYNQWGERTVLGDAKYRFKFLYVEFIDANGEYVMNPGVKNPGEESSIYKGWWIAIDITKSWLHVQADLDAQFRAIHPQIKPTLSPYESTSVRLQVSVPANTTLRVPQLIPPTGSIWDTGEGNSPDGWQYDLEDSLVINYNAQGRLISADSEGAITTNWMGIAEAVQYPGEHLGVPTIDVPTAFVQFDGTSPDVEQVDVQINPDMFLSKSTDPTEIGAYIDVSSPGGKWCLLSANWVEQVPPEQGTDALVEAEFPAFLFRTWAGDEPDYWERDRTIWHNIANPNNYAHNKILSKATVESLPAGDGYGTLGQLKVAPNAIADNPVPQRISPFNGLPASGTLRLRFARPTVAGGIEFVEFDATIGYNYASTLSPEAKVMPLATFNAPYEAIVYSPMTTVSQDNGDLLPPFIDSAQRREIAFNFLHQYDHLIPTALVEIPKEIADKVADFANRIGQGQLSPDSLETFFRFNDGNNYSPSWDEFAAMVDVGRYPPNGNSRILLDMMSIDYFPPAHEQWNTLEINFYGDVDETFIAHQLLTPQILPFMNSPGLGMTNDTDTFPITVTNVTGGYGTPGTYGVMEIVLFYPPGSAQNGEPGSDFGGVLTHRGTSPADFADIGAAFPNFNIDMSYDEGTDTLTINDVKGAPLYLAINHYDGVTSAPPVINGVTWKQEGEFPARFPLDQQNPNAGFQDVTAYQWGTVLPMTEGPLVMVPEPPVPLTAKLIAATTDQQTLLASEDYVIGASDQALGTWAASVVHDGLTIIPSEEKVFEESVAAMTLTHPAEVPLSRFAYSNPDNIVDPTTLYPHAVGYPMALEVTDVEFVNAVKSAVANGPETIIARLSATNGHPYQTFPIRAKHVTVSPDELTVTMAFNGFGSYQLSVNYDIQVWLNFDDLVPGKWQQWTYEVKASVTGIDIPATDETNHNTPMDITGIWATAARRVYMGIFDGPSAGWSSDGSVDHNVTGESMYYLVDNAVPMDMDFSAKDKMVIDYVFDGTSQTAALTVKAGYTRSANTSIMLWLEGATVPPEFSVGSNPYKVVQFAHGVGIFTILPAFDLVVQPTTIEACSFKRTTTTNVAYAAKADVAQYPVGMTDNNIVAYFYPGITSESQIPDLNGQRISFNFLIDNSTWTGNRTLNTAAQDSGKWNYTLNTEIPGLLIADKKVPYDKNYRIAELVNQPA